MRLNYTFAFTFIRALLLEIEMDGSCRCMLDTEVKPVSALGLVALIFVGIFRINEREARCSPFLLRRFSTQICEYK